MNQDYEVFISYRHNPCNALAEALYKKLALYSVDSFRDAEELHFGDFRRQLIKNNLRSRYLVLLLSPGMLDRCSNPNDWITKEVSLFLKLGKPIIPVKLPGFEWPKELPQKIQGLRKFERNAITCDITDTISAAEYISNKVYHIIRKGWSAKKCQDSISSKDYLSRFNTDVDSYFCDSALRFRKYAFLTAAQLLMTLVVYNVDKQSTSGPGAGIFYLFFFSILTLYLIFFEFKEFESDLSYDEVSFVDILLDHPVREIVQHLYWGFVKWALLFVLIAGGIMLINVVLSGAFSGIFADMEVYDNSWYMSNYYTFLVLPLVRFIYKTLLALIDLLNSIFSPYPRNYCIYDAVERIRKISRIVGWVALGPAILFCNALYPMIMGGVL